MQIKKIITIGVLLVSVASYSQSINDAILFSGNDDLGTARYQAMSGAFGALGGDLSAINVNPAGAAVFKKSTIGASLSTTHKDNDMFYGLTNTSTNTDSSNLSLSQAGGLLVLPVPSKKWKKVVIGLNYQQTQNFDQDLFIAGTNNTSISQYFLNYAYGKVPFGAIELFNGDIIEHEYLDAATINYNYQQALLGVYGGVIQPLAIDPVLNPNDDFYQERAIYNTVNQEYFYNSDGNSSKINFNLSAEYGDGWYFGVNGNLHTVFTDRFTRIRENGYDPSSELTYVDFENFLRTTGAGGSVQLGVIKKIGFARLGVSYQSPIWYRLEDEQWQKIRSNQADPEIHFIDENQITVFEKYTLRTPSKLTGSAALVFGKVGLLSFDYNYQDFDNIELRPSSDFNTTNQYFGMNLKGASSFKVGGELRAKNWSFRGGYRFEESPYENENIMGDLTGFSLGFGYNFGRTKFDVAYARSSREMQQDVFEIDSAKLEQVTTHINATLQFSFF